MTPVLDFCGRRIAWPLPLLMLALLDVRGAALRWDSSGDTNIAGYKVHYGFATRSYSHSIDVGRNTTWTIRGLSSAIRHYLAVTAYSYRGGQSEYSDEIAYTPGLVSTLNFTNPLFVPDGSLVGIRDSHPVSSPIASLSRVRVTLKVAGQFNGDLYATISHIGSNEIDSCVLLNRPGRSIAAPWGYDDSGMDVVFDSSPQFADIHAYRESSIPPFGTPLLGIWQPDGRDVEPWAVLDTDIRATSLTSFIGEPATGEWNLHLADADFGATNFLVNWGIELIGRTTPDVMWQPPQDIVYGAPLSSTQLNATSSIPGTFIYDPPAGTVPWSGRFFLSATFIPDDLNSYISVTTNVALTVKKRALVISANDQESIFGSPIPEFSASFSGFAVGDSVASLETPLVLTSEATPSSSVGRYNIVAAEASSPNYDITFINGTITINAAPLLIIADNKTRKYGAEFTNFTATYAGFVNGDTSAALDSSPVFATTATSLSPIGNYAITVSGAISSNYSISFVSGTLAILPIDWVSSLSSSLNPSRPEEVITLAFNASAPPPFKELPMGSIAFVINTQRFSVPLLDGRASFSVSTLLHGSNSIVAEYAPSGNFNGITNVLSPPQIVNLPPHAIGDALSRHISGGVKVLASTLLSNDSDPDGDFVAFLEVESTSSRGAAITNIGDWIYYIPSPELHTADAFHYTVKDAFGALSSALVHVTIVSELGSSLGGIRRLLDGTYQIRIPGVPGFEYGLQFTDDINLGAWQSLGAATADEFGFVEIIDSTAPIGQRFYRSVFP